MGKMAKALAAAIGAHNLNTELVVYLQCKDKTPTRGLWNQGSRRGLSSLLTVLLSAQGPKYILVIAPSDNELKKVQRSAPISRDVKKLVCRLQLCRVQLPVWLSRPPSSIQGAWIGHNPRIPCLGKPRASLVSI